MTRWKTGLKAKMAGVGHLFPYFCVLYLFFNFMLLFFFWLLHNLYIFAWMFFENIFHFFVLTFKQIIGCCDQGLGSNLSSSFFWRKTMFRNWNRNSAPARYWFREYYACEARRLCNFRWVSNKWMSWTLIPRYICTHTSATHHHQCHYTTNCLSNPKKKSLNVIMLHIGHPRTRIINVKMIDSTKNRIFLSLKTEMSKKLSS